LLLIETPVFVPDSETEVSVSAILASDRLYKLFQPYPARILWQDKNIPSRFAVAKWNCQFSHAANRPGADSDLYEMKAADFFAIVFLRFSPQRSERGTNPNAT
jgi:hypothetical protein